ncbi:hypothetical protein ACLB1M_15870 [Escherichia coli]
MVVTWILNEEWACTLFWMMLAAMATCHMPVSVSKGENRHSLTNSLVMVSGKQPAGKWHRRRWR